MCPSVGKGTEWNGILSNFSACFIFYRKHKNTYVNFYFDVTFNFFITHPRNKPLKVLQSWPNSSAVKGLTDTCDRPGFEWPALHKKKRSDSMTLESEMGRVTIS